MSVNPFLESAKVAAADAIRTQFHERGSAHVVIDELAMTINQWRHVARTVGKELGRPVRTMQYGPDLHALLQDWPCDAREDALHMAALRRVSEAASLATARARRFSQGG